MKILNILIFIVIWCIGVLFVEFVIPDISNLFKMSFGYFLGSFGIIVSENLCFIILQLHDDS